MEIKKVMPLFVLALVLVQMPLAAAWNPFQPISDFLSGIEGAVVKTFDAVHKFLLRLQIVAMNIVEVLLFIVFIALLLAIFIVPAKVYAYAKEFSAPFKAFFNWARR